MDSPNRMVGQPRHRHASDRSLSAATGLQTDAATWEPVSRSSATVGAHPWLLLVATEFVVASWPSILSRMAMGAWVGIVPAGIDAQHLPCGRIVRFISTDRQIERPHSLYHTVLH